jgi:hypothetical protein
MLCAINLVNCESVSSFEVKYFSLSQHDSNTCKIHPPHRAVQSSLAARKLSSCESYHTNSVPGGLSGEVKAVVLPSRNARALVWRSQTVQRKSMFCCVSPSGLTLVAQGNAWIRVATPHL